MDVLLNNLQIQLEQVYEIESRHRVHDFVIHDALLVSQLDNSQNARDLPEKLLIHQDGENIDLALYLDEKILKRLEKFNPLTRLSDNNIYDFWIALEGISHFVYLTYNAKYRRAVSLFELELQAEVDKYIMAVHLLARQGSDSVPSSLHYHLYNNAEFDQRLEDYELYRYCQANELASRFSAFIEHCINHRVSSSRISNTLRRFYRLTHHQKIRSIMNLAA